MHLDLKIRCYGPSSKVSYEKLEAKRNKTIPKNHIHFLSSSAAALSTNVLSKDSSQNKAKSTESLSMNLPA